jgi:hypothetical protein
MTGQFYCWGTMDVINPLDTELIYNNSPTNAQFYVFTWLFYIENNDKPYILWTLRDHYQGACTSIKSASDIKKEFMMFLNALYRGKWCTNSQMMNPRESKHVGVLIVFNIK